MIKPGQVFLKDNEIGILRGLMERNFAPLLIIIICEIAVKFGIIITESWRVKRHSGDLHGTQPVRAIDLRSWCYEDDQTAYDILHWINRTWMYDPDRPNKDIAIIHDAGQGTHFHIQVHPNTRRK